MVKNIVIAGSASLVDKIGVWKNYWINKGYNVIDYPKQINKDTFMEDYPSVHIGFHKSILDTDILFVMNENKNGVEGYIGAQVYSELVFGTMQNLIYNKNIEVILLKEPSKGVQSYDEIKRFLDLGWIKLFNENDFN